MLTTTAVSATSDEYDRTIAALVAAFVGDPFVRWMFPDPRQYLHHFPQVLRHFGGGAFAHGSAYRSADFRAAALWLPPGVAPDEEALGAAMEEAIAPERQEAVFAVLEQVDASHPEEPHWYLPVIGVDPLCQGQGYGSALLARGVAACDRDHVAAYLESSNPRNVPLYQRFGFEVVGEIRVDGETGLTPMWRPAR